MYQVRVSPELAPAEQAASSPEAVISAADAARLRRTRSMRPPRLTYLRCTARRRCCKQARPMWRLWIVPIQEPFSRLWRCLGPPSATPFGVRASLAAQSEGRGQDGSSRGGPGCGGSRYHGTLSALVGLVEQGSPEFLSVARGKAGTTRSRRRGPQSPRSSGCSPSTTICRAVSSPTPPEVHLELSVADLVVDRAPRSPASCGPAAVSPGSRSRSSRCSRRSRTVGSPADERPVTSAGPAGPPGRSRGRRPRGRGATLRSGWRWRGRA